MKKIIILTQMMLMCALAVNAQVLCVNCYDQNAQILTNTNNLIFNGGFETSNCIPDVSHSHSWCPASSSYDCDLPNWVSTGGGIGTYASLINLAIGNFSHIVEGDKAIYFGNGFCNACSSNINDTLCINMMNCEASGIPAGFPYNTATLGGTDGVSLTQTVTGLTPGTIYALEFWTGGEWQSIFTRDGLFAVDVGFGRIWLRNPGTAPGSGIGRRFVIVFMADTASHDITFTNWGHIAGSTGVNRASELVLDDVRMFEMNTSPCPLSIDEFGIGPDVEVFPNPFSDLLMLTTAHNILAEFILYDMTGRIVVRNEFDKTTEINTGFLSSGMYLFEFRHNNEVIHKGKVVKE